MRTKALINHFHDLQPIYSAHFEPGAKGRLATAGGDNNVRIWQIHELPDGELKVVYLSTLSRHTQAVNVVRFSPKSSSPLLYNQSFMCLTTWVDPVLASAGDDGVVCIWVPSDSRDHAFGDTTEQHVEDKESWRVKHMCRSSGSEIYDLVWSPDGIYILTGSMDNIARIYDSRDGQCIRNIGEHSHYVQGVAWDPLGEYIATQSSDRSVHIWALKTRDGQFTLSQYNRSTRIELPTRRISGSPAPTDMATLFAPTRSNQGHDIAPSPTPSTPGTPTSMSMPMNPPPFSSSRRSSFSGSPAQSSVSAFRRSASPSPALPLPAVKPSSSPKAQPGPKSMYLFHNEALLSFFRRLSFSTDGSLLLAPAGQYRSGTSNGHEHPSKAEELSNTVFVYTRAGLNKPPVAHLPGHKKPSIAVRFSPIYYKLRTGPPKITENLTIDTSSDGSIPALPPPVVDPDPMSDETKGSVVENGSTPATIMFSLPYRMVYAIATQDSVLIYDTQQHTPLCVISNLHYATFTDLTWSTDGNMLIMTSTDGFCSTIIFENGELGEIHPGPAPTTISSAISRPSPSTLSSPSFPTPSARASSPTRSNSSSSVATLSGFASSTPKISQVPPAALSAPSPSSAFIQPTVSSSHQGGTRNLSISSSGSLPILNTPPETPAAQKRDSGTPTESNPVDEPKSKRRRITPTLISPADMTRNKSA